jgi:hypothetical protein
VRRALCVVVASIALMVAGSAGAATPPLIGTATAAGSFRVDRSTIRGNATLFEGSLVETNASISWLELPGGTVLLAAFSRARVFEGHVSLEAGAGEFEHVTGLRMEAPGLIVQPEGDRGSARVTLGNGGRVTVAAFSGSFRALNARNRLIANIRPGSTLEFNPQPSGAPSRVTGCLVNRRGHFVMTDETTNVVVEVAGPALQKEQGNRVEVAGTMDPATTPVSEASQYIRVTSVKRISKGCGSRSAAPAGSDGAAGKAGSAGAGTAGTSAGKSAGTISLTTIAILGGVAVAAVVGGLAVARKLPGQASPPGLISK